MEDEQREIIDHKENVVQENHPFEILCKVETTASAPSATSLHTTKNTPYKAHSSSSSCSTSSYSNLSSVACNMNQTTSVSPTSACSSTSTSSSLSTSFISSSQSLSQYEREKRELTLQLKIKEEKLKSLMNRNEYLEETNKRLQTMNENKENDLIKLKKEISTLMTEKDNLSNEIRKLSRSQNTSSDSSTSSLSSSSSSSSSLWGQMTAASRELCRAEEQINSLNHEIVDLKTTQCALQRQLEKYQEKELVSEHYTKDLEEEKEKRVIAESQLILAQHDNEELLNRIRELEKSLVENEAQYEEAITSLNDEIRRLEEMPKEGIALITSESFSDNYHHDGDTKSSVVEYQSIEIEKYLTTIEELKDKLFESEKARRKLHNKLQDLKGNVRVYVRCRPFLPSDNDENGEISCVNCNADGTTITLTEHAQRGIGQVYQFDQVYNSAKTQYDIFKDVSDFVQSALDGYRVCVFSYGQTGSGKTHTMTGYGKEEDRGLIPRSVEHIITQINDMKSSGWSVEATYSMLEVYNETLIDLLSNECNSDHKLKVMFQNDRVVIPQLTAVPMLSDCVDDALDQLQEILYKANTARTTASTAMNERSSRSHVLFMMNIQSIHQDGTILQGGLRLVDLAGSERLDRCGTSSDAQRFRETVNINKSLSCLGEVFMALGHKSSHVPFRNSKLTMLLQDCLSGEGKTLMLVNISPTVGSGHETYCSLKFASQVNQVQLGTAKKNITIMTKPAASTTIPPPPVPAPSSVTSTNLSTLQTSAASSPPPPTTRSRPILPTHQNSLTAVSSSPNTTTTLVPSQVINSVNGNKSQIAYAPAARITTNQITNLESKVESSVLKQGPVAMTSTRTKRQISSSQVTTSSTTLPVASAFSSTTNNNILQASKRVKSSKLGTWR